ncbi:four helix bundle protein, partial [Ralstonia pickettii]|uniref:four helix bundle protein n=1 Tax=Ralstonia pickettii TaxID=329 RepID=UPI002175D92C
RSIGEKISAECIEIMVLVFRANVAADKAPHLGELIERLQVIELLLRLGMDKRLISRPAYAKAVEITTSIGKQANGWKKSANRQLQAHMTELGRRWYAGDAAAVDEFLQLYCIEVDLRAHACAIAATQQQEGE